MNGLIESIRKGETCWIVYSHKRFKNRELENYLQSVTRNEPDDGIRKISIETQNAYGYFLVSPKFKFFPNIHSRRH